MKSLIQKSLIGSLVSLAITLPLSSHAQKIHKLTIINHYDKNIAFTISINPDVLSDLPTEFTVPQNGQVQSTVLANNKEAYIRGEDVSNTDKSVFFGVDVSNDVTTIYGYSGSHGIAYSWQPGSEIVTFCTPAEYNQNGHC